MKKIILPITLVCIALCAFCFFGCQNRQEDGSSASKSEVWLSDTEITLTKGDTATVTALSDKKIDTLSLKWKNSNSKVANFTKSGVNIVVKAIKSGTSEITLSMSGKVVGTVKITVVDPILSVRLPQGKIVLTQGQSATITAVTTLSVSSEPLWTVECDDIALETQGMIARITVSDTCPDGEYKASVKKGDEVCVFTIIVGK